MSRVKALLVTVAFLALVKLLVYELALLFTFLYVTSFQDAQLDVLTILVGLALFLIIGLAHRLHTVQSTLAEQMEDLADSMESKAVLREERLERRLGCEASRIAMSYMGRIHRQNFSPQG